MPKHEVKKPTWGLPGAHQFQSQMRELWGKVPLFESAPLNHEMEVSQVAVLDAHSETPSDYKLYIQTPTKIAVFDADDLITGDTPGNLKKRYRRADSGKTSLEEPEADEEGGEEASSEDYPADVVDVWDKYPVLDSRPSHGDFETAEMGILDANSEDPCDYEIYAQVPDKVVVWNFCPASEGPCPPNEIGLSLVAEIELLSWKHQPTVVTKISKGGHYFDRTKYDGITDIVFQVLISGSGWVELTDSAFNPIVRITATSSGLWEASIPSLTSQQLYLQAQKKNFIIQRARLRIFQELATKTRIQIPLICEANSSLPYEYDWGAWVTKATTRFDLPGEAIWYFTKNESHYGGTISQWMLESSKTNLSFDLWFKNKTTGNDVWGPFRVDSDVQKYKTWSNSAANFTDGDEFVVSMDKVGGYPWQPTNMQKLNLYVDVEDLTHARIYRRLFAYSDTGTGFINPWSSATDSTAWDLIDFADADYCNASVSHGIQYRIISGSGWKSEVHDSSHSVLTGSQISLTSSSIAQATSSAITMADDEIHGATTNTSAGQIHIAADFLFIDATTAV